MYIRNGDDIISFCIHNYQRTVDDGEDYDYDHDSDHDGDHHYGYSDHHDDANERLLC